MIRLLLRWFFRPSTPRVLAAFRLATHGWMLWYLSRRWRLITRTAAGPRRDFDPVGVARPLRRPLPVRLVKVLTAATLGTTTLAGLGVAHRITGPLNAALVWWTLTYRNSWSMIFHNDNLAVLHVTILGLAPAADVWSVDRWRARRGDRVDARVASGRYGWPLQLANVATVLVYALAGVAKLRGPLGWGWADGEHLRSQVAVDGVRKALLRPGSDAHPSAPVRLFEAHPWLWRILAAGSLVLELGAPVALVNSTLGRLWAGGAWSMHVGIKAVMRITFRHQLSGVPYLPLLRPPT